MDNYTTYRCPPNRLPDSENVGIPEGMFAGLMPFDTPTAMEAMKICCETDDINIGDIRNCTLWCELPESIMEPARVSSREVDMGILLNTFSRCIKLHDPPLNKTGPWIRGVSSAPARLPNLTQLGIAALGVALAIQLA